MFRAPLQLILKSPLRSDVQESVKVNFLFFQPLSTHFSYIGGIRIHNSLLIFSDERRTLQQKMDAELTELQTQLKLFQKERNTYILESTKYLNSSMGINIVYLI